MLNDYFTPCGSGALNYYKNRLFYNLVQKLFYFGFKPKNMKNILLFTMLAIAVGCHPASSPGPSSPGVMPYRYVSYWKTDTLINSLRVNGTDTLYAFTSGDTTGVYYHGSKLYVFGLFDSTTSTSFTAWIGPNPMDTATAYSKCNVGPYKYYSNGDGAWKQKSQVLTITNRAPHFATTGDAVYIGK